jgi:hypothetical protein
LRDVAHRSNRIFRESIQARTGRNANPTPKGYNCSFDWQVASANIGASMYNNISSAFFYQDKDSGKWAMRPPF